MMEGIADTSADTMELEYEFTQEEIRRGIATLEKWVADHPRPDKKKVWAGSKHGRWSPNEILGELKNRIDAGVLGKKMDAPERILQSAAKAK